MRKKVAWFGKKKPFCGNVTYSREITNLLVQKDYDVTFFHFEEESETDKEYENEIKDIKIPYFYKSQIYTIPSRKSAKVISDSLEELKPDIVHVSLCLSTLDFKLPEICHNLNIPIVCTFHNAFDKRPTFHGSASFLVYQIYSASLAQYDAVIIFSELQKEILQKMGVPENIINVIPNGIDINKFTPGKSEFRNNYPDKQIYTYMGRINSEKGLDDLLKAYTRTELNNSQLVVVGDGPQLDVLKSIFGDNKNISFLGFIQDEAKRIDILRGSDAFILPSQIEGLSISLLEAMACGTPTIATDVGSDGEVLSNGAGIIIDPLKTKSQLSFALKIINDSEDYRKLLGKKARERVVESYTLSKNVEKVIEIYDENIGKY